MAGVPQGGNKASIQVEGWRPGKAGQGKQVGLAKARCVGQVYTLSLKMPTCGSQDGGPQFWNDGVPLC